MNNNMLPKEHQARFRKTHPEYYKNYMRERRKKRTEAKIQEAYDTLYGKEE